MRFFRASDGRTLVESDDRTDVGAAGLRFVTPSGARLERASELWLVGPSGELEAVYGFATDSDHEDLVYTAHEVVGDALHRFTCAWSDTQLGDEPPRVRDAVVLAGLVLVPPPTPSFGRDAERAARALSRRGATEDPEAAARSAKRLRAPESLPDVPGSGPIDCVLDVLDFDLVLLANGRTLWREPFYDSGAKRPAEIEDVVRRRFGARLRSFDVRVDYGD